MSSSTSQPCALVTGVTGQDGYYLARLLLGRGHRVIGGTRNPQSFAAREMAQELPALEPVEFDLLKPESLRAALNAAPPNEIYHLAAMSSVAETWENPVQAVRSNTEGTLHLLEAIRHNCPETFLILAGSGDCFDHETAGARGINPITPLLCTNPYSISKAAAMQFVQSYRQQFGLRTSVAILMNHTSPRRPPAFVERKIVRQAVEIARGKERKLVLGSLETARDWSWAEDIVEGIAAIAAKRISRDFVLASGQVHTTGDWVRLTFERLGLDPAEVLEINPAELHRGDRPHTFGDIRPAELELGWMPKTGFEQIVERMVDHELRMG